MGAAPKNTSTTGGGGGGGGGGGEPVQDKVVEIAFAADKPNVMPNVMHYCLIPDDLLEEPLCEGAGTIHSQQVSAEEKDVAREDAPEVGGTAVPRKRGRPKGSASKKKDLAIPVSIIRSMRQKGNPKSSLIVDKSVEPAGAPVEVTHLADASKIVGPSKKGRGRPKGSLSKKRELAPPIKPPTRDRKPTMKHQEHQEIFESVSKGKRGSAALGESPNRKRKMVDGVLEGDVLYGCTKCRYLRHGCSYCQNRPAFIRPPLRWDPAKGRPQTGILNAPTFRPTPQEFKDPIAYIEAIAPEAEKYGLAHIVPPAGWNPPFALDKGTNGMSMESFRFSVRKQHTSHLCNRAAPVKGAAAHQTPGEAGKNLSTTRPVQVSREEDVPDFGFVALDKTQTLRSFSAYADWAKELHFSQPFPKGPATDGHHTDTRPQKRPKTLPYNRSLPACIREPSVEEVEAEFWRVIEDCDETVDALYGQDLDSGHHGSGFPLPEWRRQLLEQHLSKTGSVSQPLPPYATKAETEYAEHPWNINNMPRSTNSVLRYLLGDELITGVMVPWLYVGSALSAFCWHVEDHALYSVNYLHLGSPKVWYGVPATATAALEEAMRDALPHLFEASPNLLYQLVTMMSPLELKKRGIPVCRVVHEPGSFVVTMPDAYHAGFNTGFNVAEAVNFGAPRWLPFGTDIATKYRKSHKPLTMSHDSLLLALVMAAQKKSDWNNTADDKGNNGEESGGIPRKSSSHKQLPCCDKTAPLGEIPWHHVPDHAIALAAGELALRADEERRRYSVGLESVHGGWPMQRRMDSAAKAAAKDENGNYLNTADVDCAVCATDLWLSAIVSAAVPGVAVCPEHTNHLLEAGAHRAPVDSVTLLYRYTPSELDALVNFAVNTRAGAEKSVAAAKSRGERRAAECMKAIPIGPLYPVRIPADTNGVHPSQKKKQKTQKKAKKVRVLKMAVEMSAASEDDDGEENNVCDGGAAEDDGIVGEDEDADFDVRRESARRGRRRLKKPQNLNQVARSLLLPEQLELLPNLESELCQSSLLEFMQPHDVHMESQSEAEGVQNEEECKNEQILSKLILKGNCITSSPTASTDFDVGDLLM